MSFWAFIAPCYEGRLQHYEGLDLGRCAEGELLAAAREASALRKFIADLVEEGYTDTAALLRDRTDAADRLQRFLGAALEFLGPPPERERFYLIPDPVRLQIPPTNEAFAGAPEISLHDYMDQLKARSSDPVDISGCFDDRGRCGAGSTRPRRSWPKWSASCGGSTTGCGLAPAWFRCRCCATPCWSTWA